MKRGRTTRRGTRLAGHVSFHLSERRRSAARIDFLPREINYRLIYNDICDRTSKWSDSKHYDLVDEDSCKGNHGKKITHIYIYIFVLRAFNVILIEEFEFQMLSTGPVSTTPVYMMDEISRKGGTPLYYDPHWRIDRPFFPTEPRRPRKT